jgi:hypothetical protein
MRISTIPVPPAVAAPDSPASAPAVVAPVVKTAAVAAETASLCPLCSVKATYEQFLSLSSSGRLLHMVEVIRYSRYRYERVISSLPDVPARVLSRQKYAPDGVLVEEHKASEQNATEFRRNGKEYALGLAVANPLACMRSLDSEFRFLVERVSNRKTTTQVWNSARMTFLPLRTFV